MEKKQRMFYFGTNGCAEHYALPINSDLPNVKSDDWERFDGAMLIRIRKYGTYSQAKLFGSEWSVYAVPWSVDNVSGGCHTDFLWEGEHTKEEMEAYIKQNAFLRRQLRFNLEANMVNRGDIVHASDDSLIKIHHIGAEITKSEGWHDYKDKGDIPQNEGWFLLRAEHVCDGETIVNYFVASWKSGGAGDCLDKIADSHKDYNITHWRYINKPKGVEE